MTSFPSEILKALAAGLPNECVVLNHEGGLVWANKTAQQKLGEYFWSLSENHFFCSKNPVIENWQRAIRQSALSITSNQKISDDLIVNRIERPSGDPLYLVIETETEMNRHLFWKVLSAREMEIAELAAQGYSPLNIGALLSISVGTVRVHLKNIYRKLRVSSRVELALKLNS